MSKIVERTIDFFELFAREQRPLTLSEIARFLDIPLSSCHDVVSTLRQRGYVYQVGQREGFYVTRRMMDLTTKASRVDLTVQRAESRLRALRDATGETVALARGSAMTLTYVLVVPSLSSFSVHINVGDPVRAYHATSAGKAFLGGMPVDQQRAYLRNSGLEPLTSNTITDVEQLITELALSEQQGIYLNREESVEGVTTVSGRFTFSGVTYVITIPGPSVRVLHKLDEVIEQVKAACADLSREQDARTDSIAQLSPT
ncbi:IclR family transcriptional regulator [Prauserella oleivorans]|uniref:IclR family transcriptional regulator n=1 Tax=Prauserella oleivorans TaxID=1478153 RepID=A0ABW5W697_9PSEU